MINVSEPFLPPLADYIHLLEKIWEDKWVTNNGPILQDLESQLREKLSVENLSFVSNGTIALQIAIKALNITGDVITTPFSYVATTSSICWEGCNPIFVDIDKDTLNIDVSKIEEKITSETSAILATHVYGNPCEVEELERIGKEHNIKIIYDAAHAFGVSYKGQSLFNFGDISTCSTHATKLFHTIEGGFVVAKNKEIQAEVDFMRNFGHNGPFKFATVGINGKNSEFHAAMGIINLRYQDEITKKRKEVSEIYDEKLKNADIKKPIWNAHSSPNYSYYPIIFESEEALNRCNTALMDAGIFGRRYFYPTLPSSLPYIQDHKDLPVSDEMSKRVFCLPLHLSVSEKDVDLISEIIFKNL